MLLVRLDYKDEYYEKVFKIGLHGLFFYWSFINNKISFLDYGKSMLFFYLSFVSIFETKSTFWWKKISLRYNAFAVMIHTKFPSLIIADDLKTSEANTFVSKNPKLKNVDKLQLDAVLILLKVRVFPSVPLCICLYVFPGGRTALVSSVDLWKYSRYIVRS